MPVLPGESSIGNVSEHIDGNGAARRVIVTSFSRDEGARVQKTGLRYEVEVDGVVESTERVSLLHWFERDHFGEMARAAGVDVVRVFDGEATPTTTHDTAFTFLLQRPRSDAAPA